MTSTLVAVLVVTLLLPGLALMFAVVIRYLLRGAKHRQDVEDADDNASAGT